MNKHISKYDEILCLPHHVSTTRKPMSLHDRAAQFAPFAALSGHDEAINETARHTDERVELSADEQQALTRRLAYALKKNVAITICYFSSDPLKEGGTYLTLRGTVKKIDEYDSTLVLTDGVAIPLADIHSITGPIFNNLKE